MQALVVTILIVSFFFSGITEENLAKLCEHAQIPSDYRFVNNVLFS